jgi:hypothetical protein
MKGVWSLFLLCAGIIDIQTLFGHVAYPDFYFGMVLRKGCAGLTAQLFLEVFAPAFILQMSWLAYARDRTARVLKMCSYDLLEVIAIQERSFQHLYSSNS